MNLDDQLREVLWRRQEILRREAEAKLALEELKTQAASNETDALNIMNALGWDAYQFEGYGTFTKRENIYAKVTSELTPEVVAEFENAGMGDLPKLTVNSSSLSAKVRKDGLPDNLVAHVEVRVTESLTLKKGS